MLLTLRICHSQGFILNISTEPKVKPVAAPSVNHTRICHPILSNLPSVKSGHADSGDHRGTCQLKSAIKREDVKEMVRLSGILHKTSVCGSQMPPLQGGTEVWQRWGQSVMVNICQLSVYNRRPHLHACQVFRGHDHRFPAMGGEAQRPCLKTKILYRTR